MKKNKPIISLGHDSMYGVHLVAKGLKVNSQYEQIEIDWNSSYPESMEKNSQLKRPIRKREKQMKKIEQFYNILIQRRVKYAREIYDLDIKLSAIDTISSNTLESKNIIENTYKLSILKDKLSVIIDMIKEYEFLYSSELDVIKGYCLEFKVK